MLIRGDGDSLSANELAMSNNNNPHIEELPAINQDLLLRHFELLKLAEMSNYSYSANFSQIEELSNLSIQLDISVVQKFQNNIRVSYSSLIALLITYALFMVLGVVGNCLVVAAVVRNTTLRTARNLFLLNLAFSDLLLCLLTMPLTILEIVTQHWPLSETACKTAGTLQGSTVFASTLSIVAIALDRHMVCHNHCKLLYR